MFYVCKLQKRGRWRVDLTNRLGILFEVEVFPQVEIFLQVAMLQTRGAERHVSLSSTCFEIAEIQVKQEIVRFVPCLSN